MTVCAVCGNENRADARFCDSCGAPLAGGAVREVRKMVTVLFCDVSGSTALGERIDPESLRRVMARYFGTAKSVVERHGGTVEKFIGDAVMAAFGIPVTHEDDALRAIRAADDLHQALVTLNEELYRDYGTRLELRMGVNTGEVVTGTEERLATGDAVNVAARLEQAAQPGQVLLGENTFSLVRDAVEVEHIAPLELKGKSEPVQAFVLRALAHEVPTTARRTKAPMVGRDRQRRLLDDAFTNVVSQRTCHLFTVLGTAGVGKSRLVEEFLRGLPARVVRGRCLSYGEGITYWPVTEVVEELLGDEWRSALATLGLDETSAALSPILGEREGSTSAEEIAWAVRKLLEATAMSQPLVAVFDDIHWGEPTFLDLIDHVADFTRDVPVLLLCIARPELLERRASWSGGKLNATTILLEPLDPDETDELIERLLAGQQIDEQLRSRILDGAGGNPLFLEEMVEMLSAEVADHGEGRIAVPPTIHALLAARLDQLESSERAVLEWGSVEGQVFHTGAILALAPERTDMTSDLMALVRKDLVRPERPEVQGEDAFRFRHLLIRDAAYESLAKATRGELHERFAAWLEERASRSIVELDEIVGYHLERAYRYREELGRVGEPERALTRRGAARLHAAGRRAFARGDMPAAAKLLARAASLLSTDEPDRLDILVALGSALIETGELGRAEMVLLDALEGAVAADRRLVALHARIEGAYLTAIKDPEGMDELQAVASKAIPAFDEIDDHIGLTRAWFALGMVNHQRGQGAPAVDAFERALQYAREAGDEGRATSIVSQLVPELANGPMPVRDALLRCETIVDEAAGNRIILSTCLGVMGLLEAMQGNIVEGRTLCARARDVAEEFGLPFLTAAVDYRVWSIETLAARPREAEAAIRRRYDLLVAVGEKAFCSTAAACLACTLAELGELDEALRFAEVSEQLAASDDIHSHVPLRLARASVMRERGDLDAAHAIAREAVRLVLPLDYLNLRASALLNLAYVERELDSTAQAHRLAGEAVTLYERKGNRMSAAAASHLLA